MTGAITDVPGITVGHYTDREAVTGCTVVLCPCGALAGVDVRGAQRREQERPTLCVLCLLWARPMLSCLVVAAPLDWMQPEV